MLFDADINIISFFSYPNAVDVFYFLLITKMSEMLGSLPSSYVYIGVNVLVCTVPHPWYTQSNLYEFTGTRAQLDKNYSSTGAVLLD